MALLHRNEREEENLLTVQTLGQPAFTQGWRLVQRYLGHEVARLERSLRTCDAGQLAGIQGELRGLERAMQSVDQLQREPDMLAPVK